MDCENINESVIHYLDGHLTDSELKAFNAHLNGCDECTRLFDEVNKTYSLIDIKKKIDVSDDFYLSTLSGLKKDKQTRIRSIFYNVLKPITVAASIGLGILIGNGELSLLLSSEIENEEISNLMSPSTPAVFSVWESLDIDNGN